MAICRFWVIVVFAGLAVTCNSYDYCCDFETETACSWSNISPDLVWVWSGSAKPDSTSNPDFNEPVSGYMWLQSQGDGATLTGVITSTLVLISDGDVLSLDEYVYSASSLASLSLVFRDNLGREVELASISSSSWYHYSSSCGTQANSCCVTYPCSGWIDVVGTVTTSQDLVAFDNVTINNCPADVSTTGSFFRR